jgi:hypothetical protein
LLTYNSKTSETKNEREERKKKIENQRNQLEEIVDNQTVNKTNTVGMHLPSRFGARFWQCGSPSVFSCTMAWRSFMSWISGGQCFASSWWVFLPSVAPASQQDFWYVVLTLSAYSL